MASATATTDPVRRGKQSLAPRRIEAVEKLPSFGICVCVRFHRMDIPPGTLAAPSLPWRSAPADAAARQRSAIGDGIFALLLPTFPGPRLIRPPGVVHAVWHEQTAPVPYVVPKPSSPIHVAPRV